MSSGKSPFEWRVSPDEAGMRLDQFLCAKLPGYSRARLGELIAEGKALVDRQPRKRSFRLNAEQLVRLRCLPTERPPHDLSPVHIPLEVVFEDEHLLVVNKPRGMATHPAASLRSPTLVNALLARGQALSGAGAAYRPGIVHRLDKDTTGLIVVAKSDAAHLSLARQFERRTAHRLYVAVLEGDLHRERLRVEAPLARDRKNRLRMAPHPEGRPAVTHLAKIARLDRGTLVAARLETGRTHQIRAHCRVIGMPVLGDELYGGFRGERYPLQLHAALLAFEHPATKRRIAFFCPPPEDFLGREFVEESGLKNLWPSDSE